MVCDLWGHRQQFGGGDSNFTSVVKELEDMDLSALCAMDRASLWASSNQEAYGDGSSNFLPRKMAVTSRLSGCALLGWVWNDLRGCGCVGHSSWKGDGGLEDFDVVGGRIKQGRMLGGEGGHRQCVLRDEQDDFFQRRLPKPVVVF